jgi:hypothetical protein
VLSALIALSSLAVSYLKPLGSCTEGIACFSAATLRYTVFRVKVRVRVRVRVRARDSNVAKYHSQPLHISLYYMYDAMRVCHLSELTFE